MKYLLAFTILVSCNIIIAQTTQQAAVLVQALASMSPLQIELRWDQDPSATSYTVYRKHASSGTWGAALSTLNDTVYIDQTVSIDQLYDYRVVKSASGYSGQGYVRSAVNLIPSVNRGNALIIAEASIALNLSTELAELQRDIASDGWMPELIQVSADTTVAYVKSIILDRYENTDSLTMVYLVGHVPVPYSGNLGPDGHSNHIGAWPADVFYADVDGNWTDQNIYNVSASDPRNHNEPGDGKYDQSLLPGDGIAELQIGRIDFSNLTYFNKDEIELTRAYLKRTHDYKVGQWQLPKRGLIDDNFGYFGGEAFASVAWRNFAPLVGKDNIFSSDYRGTLDTAGYLFSYGCGGGSHESAGGIGNSSQLAGDSLQTGFTMLFGSYFGDWDRQNNFLRSALAQGKTMSISWAGRPWWHYQFMGLGGTIGECASLTQSNAGVFATSYGAQFVHIAQLGDPSLRISYLPIPPSIDVQLVEDYHVQINWTASSGQVDGYDIYRSRDGELWQKVNEALVSANSFIDSCVLSSGTYVYMVRTVQLESNFSGSFYNHSLGILDTLEIVEDKHPNITLHTVTQPDWQSSLLSFEAQGTWVDDYAWYIGNETLNGASFQKDHTTIEGITPQFNYIIEATNGCATESQSGEGQFVPVGVGDRISEQLRLYPNPTQGGKLYIEGVDKAVNYSVYDASGRILKESVLNDGYIQLQGYSPGMYLLEIATDQPSTFRVVIEGE